MTTNNDTEQKAVAEALSHAVNVFGDGESMLAALFLADHRTLIQRKAVVFLEFFRQLAEDYRNGYYDERDEAAGKLAEVIDKAADEAGFGSDLPLI